MMMRRFACLTLTLPILAGGVVLAEEPMRDKVDRGVDNTKTEMRDAKDSVKDRMSRDTKAAPGTKRLSECMGMNVYSWDGNEKLGDVKDIVLDGNSDQISYMVLSYGGIMGMGDKYFAVPFAAFKHKDADDKAYLNITKEELKTATGFDKDNWPNLADAQFRADMNKLYKVDANKITDKTVDATRNQQTVTEQNAKTALKTGPMKDGLVWHRRASAVIGTNVENSNGDNIGEIKDLVADKMSGRINYAVLSHGGIMGMGDKLSAIPMSAVQSKADAQKFVVNISKDQVKSMPTFDKNNWPDFASDQTRMDLDKYYNTGRTVDTAKTE